MKTWVVWLVFLLTISYLGRSFMPGPIMFEFHDQTQAARVLEYTQNIVSLKLPPRTASGFSFGLSYPLFNFYAPASYTVTSLFHLAGFDVADSLKLSFGLALVLMFLGMYRYLKEFSSSFASLLGAVLYVSSPYLAMEIFVRGNLAEVWFMAILPWALYLLNENAKETASPLTLAFSVIVVGMVLAVHNIFSLLFLPLAFFYSFLTKKPFRNLITVGFGALLASFFLLPAIFEQNLVWAQSAAKLTSYRDHFLCWSQLWTSPFWGYGGSVPGCIDGMSFKLGKLQILLGTLGVLTLTWNFLRKNTRSVGMVKTVFWLLVLVGSAFLTTESSAFIWTHFPVLALFQFPWRFLIFTLFGLSALSAFAFSQSKHWSVKSAVTFLILASLYINGKYFIRPSIRKTEYLKIYASSTYIHTQAAFAVKEYLPKTASFPAWQKLANSTPKKRQQLGLNGLPIMVLDGKKQRIIRNEPYVKEVVTDSQNSIVNIHYFPHWQLSVNGRQIRPKNFDKLGRPHLRMNGQTNTIKVQYQQTPVEKLGNTLTLITVMGLVLLILKTKWQARN